MVRVGALAGVLMTGVGLAAPARADFVVTVGNATVASGGNATVDVMIRSTNTSGDPLSSFGFEFRITSPGSRHLDFRNPQQDAQLGLPSYVFAGDSGDVVDKVPVGLIHSINGGTNNQFVGGDETNSGGNFTVKDNTLLVRLDVTAATTSGPLPGDTFSISLQPSAFTSFLNAANSPIAFSSTPGVVTVVSVPEPGALALLSIGGGLALAGAGLSRRRVATLPLRIPAPLTVAVPPGRSSRCRG
jgi:hypothetical protein